MVFTLTLLPALISLMPMKRHTTPARTDRIMRPLAEFVIKFRKALLLGGLAVVVALVAGIPRLSLEDVSRR